MASMQRRPRRINNPERFGNGNSTTMTKPPLAPRRLPPRSTTSNGRARPKSRWSLPKSMETREPADDMGGRKLSNSRREQSWDEGSLVSQRHRKCDGMKGKLEQKKRATSIATSGQTNGMPPTNIKKKSKAQRKKLPSSNFALSRLFNRTKKESVAKQLDLNEIVIEPTSDSLSGSSSSRKSSQRSRSKHEQERIAANLHDTMRDASWRRNDRTSDDVNSQRSTSLGIEFAIEDFVRTMSGVVTACSDQKPDNNASFGDSSDSEDSIDTHSLAGSSNRRRQSLKMTPSNHSQQPLKMTPSIRIQQPKSSNGINTISQRQTNPSAGSVIGAPMSRFLGEEGYRRTEDPYSLSFLFPDNGRAVRDRKAFEQRELDKLRRNRISRGDFSVADSLSDDYTIDSSIYSESYSSTIPSKDSILGRRTSITRGSEPSSLSSGDSSFSTNFSTGTESMSKWESDISRRFVRKSSSKGSISADSSRKYGDRAQNLRIIDEYDAPELNRGTKEMLIASRNGSFSSLPRKSKRNVRERKPQKKATPLKARSSVEEQKINEAIQVIRKHAKMLGVGERDLLMAVQEKSTGDSVHSKSKLPQTKT